MGDELKDAILEFVKNEYSTDPSEEIDYATPLISGGLIDSFSMVSIKRYLEKKYSIAIPDHRATPEAFDSVNAMADLVLQFRK